MTSVIFSEKFSDLAIVFDRKAMKEIYELAISDSMAEAMLKYSFDLGDVSIDDLEEEQKMSIVYAGINQIGHSDPNVVDILTKKFLDNVLKKIEQVILQRPDMQRVKRQLQSHLLRCVEKKAELNPVVMEFDAPVENCVIEVDDGIETESAGETNVIHYNFTEKCRKV